MKTKSKVHWVTVDATGKPHAGTYAALTLHIVNDRVMASSNPELDGILFQRFMAWSK